MPAVHIATNVPSSKVNKDLNLNIWKMSCQLFEKTPRGILVHIMLDENMTYAGTNEPCGFISISSVDNLGPEQNKVFSNKLMTELESKLGIPADRIYIVFHEPEKYQVGWNKTTLVDFQPKASLEQGKGHQEAVRSVHEECAHEKQIRQ